LLALADRADEFGLDMPDEQRSMIGTMGVPADRITAEVDVSAYLDRKRNAMVAHASQITDTSFFLTMPPVAFAAVWGTEWYIRVGAEGAKPLAHSLLGSP
jgi:LmbE family N-acetylglucosaminyl deacetylase